MNTQEKIRFDDLYKKHLRALKLQGKSQKTIDSYGRAVRRISKFYDCCPDQLTTEQLEVYFAKLVDSHSWSTVKSDRNGLQFFYQHVLKREWSWVEIIKIPKVKSLPDVLTQNEISQMIKAAKKMRYKVFLLTAYSMGLRLSETLSLQVGDIDGERKTVHIRRGKGNKDRFVPLPEFTYQALRALWRKHRHPQFLFPLPGNNMIETQKATKPMNAQSIQYAMKKITIQCGIKKKFLPTHYVTASQLI